MSAKHSSNSVKKSKKPIIIAIIVAAVVICGAVAVVIGMNNGWFGGKTSSTEPTTSPTTQTQTVATQAQTSSTAQSQSESQAVSSTDADETENSGIVVPTSGGQQKSSFNATFVPNKVIDTSTGSQMTLRDFFGSAYTEGAITFNSDGTFTDTLTATENNSGAYIVEDDTITMTYTNDKNILITVDSWSGDTPSEIIVHYNGCDVYFNS